MRGCQLTYDLVVLSEPITDAEVIVDGMVAAGEELKFHFVPPGSGVVQLWDESDTERLLTVEELTVNVPGEAERLLGATQVPVPATWLEVRAERRPEAVEAARRFADEVARLTGGRVWTP